MKSEDNAYVVLVNGPNLNRLGVRRPEVYGNTTLADIASQMKAITAREQIDVRDFQSNHEGELVDFLQAHGPQSIGIVINPGALGHYGLALRDCLEDLARPTVEVHISNVHSREAFRHQLVLSPVVTGQVVGLGVSGYIMATEYLLNLWRYSERGGKA